MAEESSEEVEEGEVQDMTSRKKVKNIPSQKWCP